MRIIAGEARGRLLKMPRGSVAVRPILARIKKSLFDILRPRLGNASFLDLFAGTGSVGLEALSRGAAACVFVERERACVRAIQQNSGALGFADRATVAQQPVESYLRLARGSYDIIFIGAPYKDAHGMLALSQPCCAQIDEHGILANNGVVVVQHHKKEPLESIGGLRIVRQERYGDSMLSFLRQREQRIGEA